LHSRIDNGDFLAGTRVIARLNPHGFRRERHRDAFLKGFERKYGACRNRNSGKAGQDKYSHSSLQDRTSYVDVRMPLRKASAHDAAYDSNGNLVVPDAILNVALLMPRRIDA